MQQLLPHNTLDTVADECAGKEDDNKDQDFNDDTDRSQETEINTQVAGSKDVHDKHKDNADNYPDDCPVPEDARIIFLSFVKKTKGNTNQ